MVVDIATIASLIIAGVAATAAALAIWANIKMIQEMRKDRRLSFLMKQIEEFYSPLLTKRSQISDQDFEQDGQLIIDRFGIRSRLYLATVAFRDMLKVEMPIEEAYIKDISAMIKSNAPLSSMSKPQKERRQKGMEARYKIIKQAENDNAGLIEEIERLTNEVAFFKDC